MGDNLQQRHGQDRSRINLYESWERLYWGRELGLTDDELEAAVEAVGDRVARVREYLREQRSQ